MSFATGCSRYVRIIVCCADACSTVWSRLVLSGALRASRAAKHRRQPSLDDIDPLDDLENATAAAKEKALSGRRWGSRPMGAVVVVFVLRCFILMDRN